MLYYFIRNDFLKRFNYERLNRETDAAVSSDSPVQSAEYNRLYREWRRCEGNRFSFTGKRSSRCHTYVDGIGTHVETAENQERSALKNLCSLLTFVAFLYALAENVLVLPVILILKVFGVEISYSFHESTAYGNQYALLFVFVFEGLMKFLLPLIIARRFLKMPAKIAYPVKVKNWWAFFAAVSISLVAVSVIMFLRIHLPSNIFIINSINTTYNLSIGMDTGCMLAFLAFELIIVPVMIEMLFHGALFQGMRQFGVTFAVVMMAVINSAERHNPFSLGVVFVTLLIAGYGVWQSGSIITGIVVHMLCRGLNFFLYWFKGQPNLTGKLPPETLFIIGVFAVGVLSWLLLMFSKNKLFTMKDYGTFLAMRTKFKFSFLETPLISVWILYAILVCVEIFI